MTPWRALSWRLRCAAASVAGWLAAPRARRRARGRLQFLTRHSASGRSLHLAQVMLRDVPIWEFELARPHRAGTTALLDAEIYFLGQSMIPARVATRIGQFKPRYEPRIIDHRAETAAPASGRPARLERQWRGSR